MSRGLILKPSSTVDYKTLLLFPVPRLNCIVVMRCVVKAGLACCNFDAGWPKLALDKIVTRVFFK
jgi:hypothetical protein